MNRQKPTDEQLTEHIRAMRKGIEDADDAYTQSVVRLGEAMDRLPESKAVKRAQKALQIAEKALSVAATRLPESKEAHKAMREVRKRRRQWDAIFFGSIG